MTRLQLLLLAVLTSFVNAQKLVVVIVDGLSSTNFHRFAHLPAFRTFEEEGVWSTKLFPVFPSFGISNRHSLLTGLPPRRHGFIGDYMFNWRTGETFRNFTQPGDYKSDWWTVEPIYVTASRAKASTALFFFPECEVDWDPYPHTCVPPRPDGRTFSDESEAKAVVQASKTHDLVLVYHPWIGAEFSAAGAAHSNSKTSREIKKFQHSLERLTAQARERIDLNVLVVSTHGLVDVPRQNIRVLDEFVPMELINTTVGSGAIKQLIVKNGKTHQIYSQLRHHNPIPNVRVYYTTQKVSDMPDWYNYKKSENVADLVLVADPGYAIVTKDVTKQFPTPNLHEIPRAISGYNSQFPDVVKHPLKDFVTWSNVKNLAKITGLWLAN
ncbi:unnamed protein product [Caenorhabditis auriculariae]|uniref:glycerophosphocholine cholinephosphodiesterase n=1 Tax=Caenorhabditis auriculariae TaxID=2777116 RepID=A0A8S1HL58_9PELO|nr:unnamed protein product [Caenorhabditis auriculariae]